MDEMDAEAGKLKTLDLDLSGMWIGQYDHFPEPSPIGPVS